MAIIDRISPCLWFDGAAVAAAEFYVSVFEDAHIDHILYGPTDWPGGKAGEPLFVSFTLAGQSFSALNGGDFTRFTDAVSMMVTCKDQAEVDRFWSALTAGGEEVQCGWLRDRFGVSWQIVPAAYWTMIRDENPERAARCLGALMGMVKPDIAALTRAFHGEND